MNYLETNPIKNSTILRLFAEKNEINTNPAYQRMSGVWTLEKKQLLIDSIINEYDIPKIYFHEYDEVQKQKNNYKYKYAIIDGQQRMRTIWDFMEEKFPLAQDFVYFQKPDLKLGGLTYGIMGSQFPKIKINFDSYVLPVVGVRTDDESNIEDMFLRLNEAVPLNAAEKRNAYGGNLVESIRRISKHHFFTHKVKFPIKRYQNHEIACRFLLLEERLLKTNKIVDTKKSFLDNLAETYKTKDKHIVEEITQTVFEIVDYMAELFEDSDELLRTQGIMSVYYLLIKKAKNQGELQQINRTDLVKFQELLKINRELAQESLNEADYDLLEFDRLTQQGTNDASNIRERVRILSEFFILKNPEKLPTITNDMKA